MTGKVRSGFSGFISLVSRVFEKYDHLPILGLRHVSSSYSLYCDKNHIPNTFRPTLRHFARHTGRSPRSTRGASRGVLRCGSGAVASEGCNTHTRAEAAEAERSRCASRASPGALGGRPYRRCQPPRPVEVPTAVVRRPPAKAEGA